MFWVHKGFYSYLLFALFNLVTVWKIFHKFWTTGTRLSLLHGSENKASACNVGDTGSNSGSGRSPGNGNGNPFQYSSLVAEMVKRLSAVWETWVWFLGWEDLLEKEMAIHSSTLAWKIPWTEESGRLQSMGSWSQTRLSNFTSLPVFLPRGGGKTEEPRQRSLKGYSPWGHKELDMCEKLTLSLHTSRLWSLHYFP